MRRAAIVAPVRTPSGVDGGALSRMPAQWLASTVLSAVIERSGIEPWRIEDVAMACSRMGPASGPDLGKLAARDAGLPFAVPGFVTDRHSGSGLQAVITAAMMVQTGAADVVVAGGVEAGGDGPGGLGRNGDVQRGRGYAGPGPRGAGQVRQGQAVFGQAGPGQAGYGQAGPGQVVFGPGGYGPAGDGRSGYGQGMYGPGGHRQGGYGPVGARHGGGVAAGARVWSESSIDLANAEEVARYYGITRAEADEFAVASHRKAARAWRQGCFGAEVVSVRADRPEYGIAPDDTGGHRILRDEGIDGEMSTHTLAALRPLLSDGVVTAGNMSAHRHGASACLVVAEDRLEELGLEPMAYLVGWAAAGSDVDTASLGAAPAVAKLLGRTGFGMDDLDLIEVNEGFAVEVLALAREWDLDPNDRLNVNGSSIALGHPVGATGLRIMTTMLHELSRTGGQYALEAIALGHDHGIAALFESAVAPPPVQAPAGARFHGAAANKRSGKHRAAGVRNKWQQRP
ncbi:thiolase family protein [Nocardia shimofusensis]|uniref:thiolase family protein n=1 Tax=Nocardia shimofusensis TaxID=228596 RepID=UPI000AB4D7D5|nr:acetyl-CoA C-acyltransferase [Nocardia shimofusensis]